MQATPRYPVSTHYQQPQAASGAPWHPGWLPSALITAVILISFRPFSAPIAIVEGQVQRGGDLVNQLGFGALGLMCALLLIVARPRTLNAFNHPLIWLVAPILIMGVMLADAPMAAVRAMVFSLIVVLAAATALALPKTMAELSKALAFAVGATVLICYAGLVLYPDIAKHGSDGFEAQHAGLWRGLYDHKNMASYVFAGFALIGWFVARTGRVILGLAIAVLSFIFMVQAGSKTVLAVFPLAWMTAVIASWISFAPLRILVALAPVAALFTATLGAVLHPPLLEAIREIVPRLSYTGRTDLWEFGLQYLQAVPWTGYGFESFWNTPRVVGMEQPIELNWDVRGIVHGHNSWLDIAISFGVPGAAVFFLVLVLMPLMDFARLPQSGNAARLGTLFIGLWVLTMLGACLESFFMRRADPVWFLLLMAVFGLRITAHMTAPKRPTT
ncbi:MAG: O-antigen ligase [Pseudomonadota bacterium]